MHEYQPISDRCLQRRRLTCLAVTIDRPTTRRINCNCQDSHHQGQAALRTIKSPSCIPKAYSPRTPALNCDMPLPSTHHQPPDLSYIRILLSPCRQNRLIPSLSLEPCFVAVPQEVTSHSDPRRRILHRCVLKGLLALWDPAFTLFFLS